jgi:hypothetical protein
MTTDLQRITGRNQSVVVTPMSLGHRWMHPIHLLATPPSDSEHTHMHDTIHVTQDVAKDLNLHPVFEG